MSAKDGGTISSPALKCKLYPLICICNGCDFVWISETIIRCPYCNSGDLNTFPMIEDTPGWWYKREGLLEVVV